MKSLFISAVRHALLTVGLMGVSGAALAAEPPVMVLTQVPCQFLESENGKNQGFKSTSISDCEAINARSGDARVAAATPLQVKPGKTIFRVTNRDVPCELGFWLRSASVLKRLTLPSVSGGGLVTGKAQDYVIDLEPGEYIYSCSWNTTPDYKLVVR